MVFKTTGLFLVTAVAEILGCYLTYLWMKHGYPVKVLILAALSLALFAWLLTLHPMAAGRTYAAYGGMYVSTAILWLWLIENQTPDRWDLIGATVTMMGMGIIAFGPSSV